MMVRESVCYREREKNIEWKKMRRIQAKRLSDRKRKEWIETNRLSENLRFWTVNCSIHKRCWAVCDQNKRNWREKKRKMHWKRESIEFQEVTIWQHWSGYTMIAYSIRSVAVAASAEVA